MGTRNLTVVKKDNEIKVAQYGQWDGYLGGQGKDIVAFLLGDNNLEKLKKNLDKVRFIDAEGRDKEFIEEFDNSENRTTEQMAWFDNFISRDLGAKILYSIINSPDNEILLKNSHSFGNEGLFCEWAYMIDFDSNELVIYNSYGTKPTKGEEFYNNGQLTSGYAGVAEIERFSLDDMEKASNWMDFMEKISEIDEKYEDFEWQEYKSNPEFKNEVLELFNNTPANL